MATFTMELRHMLKSTDGNMGLDKYPIWDEAYRDTLNGKIIDHYYMREIGTETPELFIRFIERKMNEIMPFYNKFYETERMILDPFKTIDIKYVSTSNNSGDSKNKSNGEVEAGSKAEARATSSDTPQTRLKGDGDYATGVQDSYQGSKNESVSTELGESEYSQNTDSENTTSGFQGHNVELLLKFRESFLNIDVQVIQDLEPFFMLIWGTDDSYLREESRYGVLGGYGAGHGFGFRRW